MKLKHNRHRLLAGVATLLLLGGVSAQAANLTICSRDSGSKDGGINNSKFDNLRSKLTDPKVFGADSNFSNDTFTIQELPAVDTANLASCDIWFSGNTGPWTQQEKDDLNAWMNDTTADHHFVVGGCDDKDNNIADLCEAVGLQIEDHKVEPTTLVENFTTNYLDKDNPLTCGGAATIETSGSIAGRFDNLNNNEVVLLTYQTNDYPGTVTDRLDGYPKYLMTGDIDMWGNSTLSKPQLVTPGSTITTTNDVFVINVFKYAADSVTGRISANGGPLCLEDSNSITLPSQSNEVGVAMTLDLSGHFSSLTGSLVYEADGLPNGLSIDSSTGVISGTPTLPNNAQEVRIRVKDSGAILAIERYNHTITLPNRSHFVGDVVSLNLASFFTDLTASPLSYSASGLPSGLSIDSAGTISGTPNSPNTAQAVTITVTDASSNVLAEALFNHTVNNRNPKKDSDIPDQSDQAGASFSLDISSHFSDPDNNETLSYNASNLPDGLSIDSSTGVISGTISASAASTQNVTITVSDGHTPSTDATDTFVFNVNHAPTASAIPNRNSALNAAITPFSIASHFTDANGHSLSFQAAGLPAGLSISPSGQISGTPTALGNSTVTITAQDGNGGQVTQTFDYSVFNSQQPPVAQNATFSINENVSAGTHVGNVMATDPNSGDTLSYTIVSGNDSGAFSLSSTGALSVAPGASIDREQRDRYTLVVEVSDGQATDQATITVNINNVNEAPVAVNDTASTAENVTIAAIDILGNDTDPDGDSLMVTHVSVDQGIVSLNSNGSLRYQPPSNYVGTATITYGIRDNATGGLTDQGEVIVTVENDNDRDGIADPVDVDDDNDGIADVIEGDSDRDQDGIKNSFDIDADNDGVMDKLEQAGDMDGDGFANYLDLDSDNDGIFDLVEAHADLSDLQKYDADADGVIDSSYDYGQNGMADAMETQPDSGVSRFELANTDGDAHPDYLDRDSDADGLPDTIESNHRDVDSNGILDVLSADANNILYFDGLLSDNGLLDGSGKWPRDTDKDNVPNFRDLDSDNDGITDVDEAGGVDADGDGQHDNSADDNGDGMADDGVANPLPKPNSDTDMLPDYLDRDSDNDGLPDVFETDGEDTDGDGVVDNFVDEDGDGLHDPHKTLRANLRNTDRQGLPDYRDRDSDGDGISDLRESGAEDANGDGVVDAMSDTDEDGIPDNVDVDQTLGEDADADGIDDRADPDFNGEADMDQDGISDSFDGDMDGDGFSNPRSSLGVSGGGSLPDANGNGVPDVLEVDGMVLTGLQGQGCSLGSGDRHRLDPVLPALALLSLWGLWARRRKS